MTWSMRRKILYGGVSGIIILSSVVWLGFELFSTPPTCFDNKQNGGETGVDCGGPCARLCTSQSYPPIVEWARAFQMGSTTYSAAAEITNNNTGAGAYHVPYAFRIFDADNNLIVEHDGSIDIPPQQKMYIIEPRIDVGNRTPAHTFLEFSAAAVWQKIPQSALASVRISNEQLSSDGSSLTATVTNEGTIDAHNVTLDAVLFSAQGIAQAASKSLIALIPVGASEQVVFTWPVAHQGITHIDITAAPALPLVL